MFLTQNLKHLFLFCREGICRVKSLRLQWCVQFEKTPPMKKKTQSHPWEVVREIWHWTMPLMAAHVFAQQTNWPRLQPWFWWRFWWPFFRHDFYHQESTSGIVVHQNWAGDSCWETSIIYQDPFAWYRCYVVSSRRMFRHPSGQFTFSLSCHVRFQMLFFFDFWLLN